MQSIQNTKEQYTVYEVEITPPRWCTEEFGEKPVPQVVTSLALTSQQMDPVSAVDLRGTPRYLEFQPEGGDKGIWRRVERREMPLQDDHPTQTISRITKSHYPDSLTDGSRGSG